MSAAAPKAHSAGTISLLREQIRYRQRLRQRPEVVGVDSSLVHRPHRLQRCGSADAHPAKMPAQQCVLPPIFATAHEKAMPGHAPTKVASSWLRKVVVVDEGGARRGRRVVLRRAGEVA